MGHRNTIKQRPICVTFQILKAVTMKTVMLCSMVDYHIPEDCNPQANLYLLYKSNTDEVIGLLNWPNPSSTTMSLGSTKPQPEMSTKNISGGKKRLARKADNLTAICELSVQKMWDRWHLTNLWASTTCYRDSFILFYHIEQTPHLWPESGGEEVMCASAPASAFARLWLKWSSYRWSLMHVIIEQIHSLAMSPSNKRPW
jgi:hypothetical protein